MLPAGHLASRRVVLIALSGAILGRVGSASCAEPSERAVTLAMKAYQASGESDSASADELFSQAISEWRGLDPAAEELTELLAGRARLRIGRKLYAEAKEDSNEIISMMSAKVDAPTGLPQYQKSAGAFRGGASDAYVLRGLAQEGLRDWRGALSDYDRAVKLDSRTGDPLNPYTLIKRARMRSEASDSDGALDDFRMAADLFAREKNPTQIGFARAGEAVTLYGVGRRDESVKIARSVLLRTPGVTDLRVMLAADAWNHGEKEKAEYEWSFACDRISTDCIKYRDISWLNEVRRWPANLVELQKSFLESTGRLKT